MPDAGGVRRGDCCVLRCVLLCGTVWTSTRGVWGVWRGGWGLGCLAVVFLVVRAKELQRTGKGFQRGKGDIEDRSLAK